MWQIHVNNVTLVTKTGSIENQGTFGVKRTFEAESSNLEHSKTKSGLDLGGSLTFSFHRIFKAES